MREEGGGGGVGEGVKSHKKYQYRVFVPGQNERRLWGRDFKCVEL